MAILVLDAIADDRALRAFLDLSKIVYRGDRGFCAPSRDSVLNALRDDAFRDSQQALVAVEGGSALARVVARRSPQLVDDRGRRYGMLGFFEALDHPAAVDAVFRKAIGWLGESGVGPIVGPMDGDTWHKYRLNVGPFDDPPFLMEPHNPSHYAAHWERHGFRVVERYHSRRVNDIAAVLPALEGKYDDALAAGYRFDPLRMDRFEQELERFYALSVEIFKGNFLYSDISLQQFLDLYTGARPLVDPEFVRFAVAPDGTDAGFLFSFPDRFRAVAAMGGKRSLWARLRFLTLRNRTDTVNLKSLGVVRSHRRSGLASALMYLGYKTALDRGFEKVNLCLILDGNPSGDLDGGLGVVFRRYHLYQLAEDGSP